MQISWGHCHWSTVVQVENETLSSLTPLDYFHAPLLGLLIVMDFICFEEILCHCQSKSFKNIRIWFYRFFDELFSTRYLIKKQINSHKFKLSSFLNAKQLPLLDSFNFEIKLIPSTTKALTRENFHHRSANWMQTQSLAYSIFPGINNIQQPGILYCCSLAVVVGTSVTFALDGFN